MISRIIVLSGHVAAGKSTLAAGLADRFGMRILKTKEILEARVKSYGRWGRPGLQEEGDRLDRETAGLWVRHELERQLLDSPPQASVIVDSARKVEQINAIRERYGSVTTHIHLTAPIATLARRYDDRSQDSGDQHPISYEEVRMNKTEFEADLLKEIADVVVDTHRNTTEDVITRVASHLDLFNQGSRGFVDVVVGGQYGSEGKGQIASYLSTEYDLLVRVGGPNAGHKVFECPLPYTHHHLPSGTRRSHAKLYIGAGAVLRVPKLLQEIEECQVGCQRLRIDRHAMLISDEDIEQESHLVNRIGSTGQGVGTATARRITDRGGQVALAGDVAELQLYTCDTVEEIHQALRIGRRVLLEGTQGTGLSLFHGCYPHVTSRDTTVAGCLAEAGIAPNWLRRVVMVCRTYPIRVQDPPHGTSGHLSQEITLEEVAKRSGIDLATLEQTEQTSTTNRMRRIGEFDWVMLRRSSVLNSPTDIALTFADYLSSRNSAARRLGQLDPKTISFVDEIERVSSARVSLIATGFNSRSIIDRRTW